MLPCKSPAGCGLVVAHLQIRELLLQAGPLVRAEEHVGAQCLLQGSVAEVSSWHTAIGQWSATKLKSGTHLGGVGVLGLLLLLDGLRDLLSLGCLGHLRNIHRKIKGRHLRSSLHTLNTRESHLA